MTVRPTRCRYEAVSSGEMKGGSFCVRSRKSFTQRRRGSSGLNWKPHFIVCGAAVWCCGGGEVKGSVVGEVVREGDVGMM
jgi:hypothetical protein